MKKLKILILYEKDLNTVTFSIKFKVILPPHVCLLFVLLFTIFIIVVTQKLVLQQSKNVTAKCTETLSPPPSIQISLLHPIPLIIWSGVLKITPVSHPIPVIIWSEYFRSLQYAPNPTNDLVSVLQITPVRTQSH